MQTSRSLFGAGIPDLDNHQLTLWAADPFARGACSFHALGSTQQARQVLAQPLAGRLFFGSEATVARHFGKARGADASGLRAARPVREAG